MRKLKSIIVKNGETREISANQIPEEGFQTLIVENGGKLHIIYGYHNGDCGVYLRAKFISINGEIAIIEE